MKNGMNAIMDLNSKIIRNPPDKKAKKEYSDDQHKDLYINRSGNKQRRYSKLRKNSGRSILHHQNKSNMGIAQ